MNKSIHEYAAKGFNVSSEAYEKGRPGYPLEAIDFLISELKIGKNSCIADLAAGTGKLTKVLKKTAAKIIAIEPVEGMRRKFSALLPEIEIINGTAERIPLGSESLDAVFVAQAFHWFDGTAALNEIHRILKPGGKIGLIWNARDENTPWVLDLTKMIDPYERGAPRYKSGNWLRAFEKTSLFSKLSYNHFQYVQKGDVDMMVDRVGSISFIASLNDEEKKPLLEKVRKLVEPHIHPETAMIELPYRTDVFICSKL